MIHVLCGLHVVAEREWERATGLDRQKDLCDLHVADVQLAQLLGVQLADGELLGVQLGELHDVLLADGELHDVRHVDGELEL